MDWSYLHMQQRILNVLTCAFNTYLDYTQNIIPFGGQFCRISSCTYVEVLWVVGVCVETVLFYILPTTTTVWEYGEVKLG